MRLNYSREVAFAIPMRHVELRWDLNVDLLVQLCLRESLDHVSAVDVVVIDCSLAQKRADARTTKGTARDLGEVHLRGLAVAASNETTMLLV